MLHDSIPLLIGLRGNAHLLGHLVDVVAVLRGSVCPGDQSAGERGRSRTHASHDLAACFQRTAKCVSEFTPGRFTGRIGLAAHELFKVALDAIRRGDDLDICFGNICTVCHYVSPSLVRLARNASKSSADAN